MMLLRSRTTCKFDSSLTTIVTSSVKSTASHNSNREIVIGLNRATCDMETPDVYSWNKKIKINNYKNYKAWKALIDIHNLSNLQMDNSETDSFFVFVFAYLRIFKVDIIKSR